MLLIVQETAGLKQLFLTHCVDVGSDIFWSFKTIISLETDRKLMSCLIWIS